KLQYLSCPPRRALHTAGGPARLKSGGRESIVMAPRPPHDWAGARQTSGEVRHTAGRIRLVSGATSPAVWRAPEVWRARLRPRGRPLQCVVGLESSTA